MLFPPSPFLCPTCQHSIEEFVSDYEVNNIIDHFDSLPLQKSTVNNNISSNNRNSQIKWSTSSPDLNWLYSKIYQSVFQVNKKNWGFDLAGMFEPLQYAEYSSQYSGHFDWHLDLGNDKAQYRKISIVIQLSHPSEYEGGNLEVFTGGDYNNPINITPSPQKKGTAFLFPTYILHRVTPVTKGIRKSLITWVGGTPFR